MKYYLIENQKPIGPFTPEKLLERGVDGDTLVWNENLKDWTPIKNVQMLANALGLTFVKAERNPTEDNGFETEENVESPKDEATVPLAAGAAAAATLGGQMGAPQQVSQENAQQPRQPYELPSQYQRPQQQYELPPQYQQPLREAPVTNKTLSILSLMLSFVCCCNILSAVLAIIAIVKASNSTTAFKYGDIAQANAEARKARQYSLYSIIGQAIWVIASLALVTINDPETQEAFLNIFR